MAVIGWDIGGVNTKVAALMPDGTLTAQTHPFELQRAPERLAPLLARAARELGTLPAEAHAVTMTAELSQMFRVKRDGVAFILDAIEAALPSADIRVFSVNGRFLAPREARVRPLAVAAANWAATARVVARRHPDCVLVDIGTTTTDIIPIVSGAVAAIGFTDPERLASGELVYTGAVRTPAEAIANEVPFGGAMAGVSAEGFALAGDVHVWRGDLDPIAYTALTPDGRPPTREFAGERLARVVCADREVADAAAVSAIAEALAAAQTVRIAGAIRRVLARHRTLHVAVVAGLGAFLAEGAARAVGLRVVRLETEIGNAAARCAPAASVALLLEQALGSPVMPQSAQASMARPETGTRVADRIVDIVVKLGGGVLAYPDRFDAALDAIGAAARHRRLLVVPGGGPFADAVRSLDRRLRLSEDAAHWMAVLAMDQYAHLIASRLPNAVLVSDPREIGGALDAGSAGQAAILAPSRWLRDVDPLPHSWDVTSDSIAAWIAGQIGAQQLVLVKPPGASGEVVVDAWFSRTLPEHVTSVIVPADRLDILLAAVGITAADRS
jgi:probable H4MPT-linked C1 transfer pathway protein